MTPENLLSHLFPNGHDVTFDGEYFAGPAGEVSVIGTRDRAAIGAALSFRMAGEVLRICREHPGRPILLLVDTLGQKMSRRDETICLNAYIAHLAKCLDVARRRGHRIIGLVYGEAVSAGFLSSSMLADACYALPGAEVKVMNLPAMSRVTKIPLERLEELSTTSAVFAPGVANYIAMGAVRGVWEGDLARCLQDALADHDDPDTDRRREDGEARGGRTLARRVSAHVRGDAA
ncbi:biotin-independent malonate decarboxylase subunit gamma [Falsirhodobacter sp. 1013]|uniref:biotin-independent malonate decarboxylase subunit gamma n=1 Tax=Falsirhodobacter sp. 1013 TaxID=3417566 RepID=UPI003EBD6EAC